MPILEGCEKLTNRLFALDIGTRSVVGIILEEHDHSFHVLDILVEEHKERAMVDGQIHNVLKVAEVILSIKNPVRTKVWTSRKSKCCCCWPRTKNRTSRNKIRY